MPGFLGSKVVYQTWVAVASLTKVNALSARVTRELAIRITRSRAVHFVRPVQAVRNAVALQLIEKKGLVTYAITFCNVFFPTDSIHKKIEFFGEEN